MSSNDETVECPKCGERIRLTPEQADHDELIVSCPQCGVALLIAILAVR